MHISVKKKCRVKIIRVWQDYGQTIAEWDFIKFFRIKLFLLKFTWHGESFCADFEYGIYFALKLKLD
jgi:hypothetical protein